MGVTGPMKHKKSGLLSRKIMLPHMRPLFTIQAVLLTSQSLSWLLDVPLGPYARFQGATVPMWMSMVR